MQSFIITAFFLSSLAFAAPAPRAQAPPVAGNENPQQAAQNWMTDTGTVSNFLNMAPTLTGDQFKAAAAVALAAEKNELTHKAIIDAAPGLALNSASVQNANNSLVTQGHFQSVVDLLQEMTTNGDSTAITDTNAINTNRCKNVLPSIDAYLAVAGTKLLAVRPTNCDATGITASATPVATAAAQAGGNNNAGAHDQSGHGHGH
ncbi:hypothetical protein MMC10_010678 [Thelotrema lepadinum]|nr:hypothetical protein [Thelotrema lepadinum]